jgi:anthranilate synthase/aminodeoxychorismate synthase-like glutamine amidotransferase
MILLVDHQDSFTRNLEHLLASFDEVMVHDRKEIVPSMVENAKMLVLSPGPGCPADYPETQKLYQAWRGKVPILGICLGFQLMLEQEGGSIIRQSRVLHGVETDASIDPSSATYQSMGDVLRVARYHSLQIDPASLSKLPASIRITAEDPIRGVPLSFEDLDRRLFGLQYHPESFLTKYGNQLIENIRNASLDDSGATRHSS